MNHSTKRWFNVRKIALSQRTTILKPTKSLTNHTAKVLRRISPYYTRAIQTQKRDSNSLTLAQSFYSRRLTNQTPSPTLYPDWIWSSEEWCARCRIRLPPTEVAILASSPGTTSTTVCFRSSKSGFNGETSPLALMARTEFSSRLSTYTRNYSSLISLVDTEI